jgi:hypothetical protein
MADETLGSVTGSRERLLIPVFMGLAVLLGLALLSLPPLAIGLGLAAFVFLLAFPGRPELAILVVLITTSTIFAEESMPRISFGIGRLYVLDVLLISLFGLGVIRWLKDPDFEIVRSPMNVPLAGFYFIAFLSTAIAVLTGTVELKEAVTTLRYVTYYLIFFPVLNLIRREKQVKFLVAGIYVAAGVVSVLMVLQFFLGESVTLLPGRVETLMTQGRAYLGVSRILPPGQSLIFLGFVTTTVALAFSDVRPVGLLTFGRWSLLLIGVLLTFNRHFWASAVLAVPFLLYFVKGRDRRRLFVWGVVSLLCASVALLAVFREPDSAAANFTRATLERFSTLGSTETFETKDDTWQWRKFEYEYALPQIASHPLLGLGLGANYRPFLAGIDYEGFDGRYYIHNGHFWLITKIGLLGYFCFVWVSAVFVIRGLKYWRGVADPELRAIVLGFTLTYVGVLVGSIVNPMFMQWYWTPVIGTMWGVNESVLQRRF